MNLKQRIGRLFVVGFDGTQATPEIIDMIHTYHVGAVILFGRNIGTPEELLKLTHSLQREAKSAGYDHPLLICTDQENGAVRRLSEGTTIVPGSMLIGATNNPQYAYKAGFLTGKELKALGINWNLAPVADINNNPRNPVIGVRSYGEDASQVASFVEQSMKGMQAGGVQTTLKHFPGHGDTSVDSHLDLPVISHDLERLHQIELVPFKQCIESGADAIMTAHVYFPALEKTLNKPATFSKAVVTELLREKLGFNGVVTTDCMEMEAVKNGIGTVAGAVEAIKAGIDFVMISHSYHIQKEAIEHVVKAVEEGEISHSRIQQSIQRIAEMAKKYSSFDEIFEVDELPAYVGSSEHRTQMKSIYNQGITLLGSSVTKKLNKDERILIIFPENKYTSIVEDRRYSTEAFVHLLKKDHPLTMGLELKTPIQKEDIECVVSESEKFDRIIVLTLNAHTDIRQQQMLEALLEGHPKVDAVVLRNPYDAALLYKAHQVICTYEYTEMTYETVIGSLTGDMKLGGVLPVTVEGVNAG
ncbi:beta-N-acetylhexosaminidase [Jeotgalibacillus soli]|uniref:Beta-N-acetylhexosaminidase n=1 Tax=Jeotgalibacillus soli TaxID=889306 RepID=A0A0C2W053_9BACL|nr:beta-N-acetylhexosaminidase [Jeotgalibacillus soli]KIL49548.1 beta-N-acetylhexosaminidase [Jeotgalibacillus soli]